MVYNARNDLTSKTRGGSTVSYAYGYDSVRNRISLWIPGVTNVIGVSQAYGYDNANRLSVLTNVTDSLTSSFSYDKRGRAAQIQFGGNSDLDTSYTYDPTGALTVVNSFHRSNPLGVFSEETYTLDKSGRTTRVDRADGDIISYTYDREYKLTREQRNGSSSYDNTYMYDAAANRTTMMASGVTTVYTYDNRNALTKFVEAGSTTSFQYDNRGSRTLKETISESTEYTYDIESRLTKIFFQNVDTGDFTITTHQYNALGERMKSETYDGSTLTTVLEIWDGRSLMARLSTPGGTARYTVDLTGRVLSHASPEMYINSGMGTLDGALTTVGFSLDKFVATAFGEIKRDISNADVVQKFMGASQWLY
jgi:YD repeat-containing protein